jgi:DNA-binding MarR family transcriptional regulator
LEPTFLNILAKHCAEGQDRRWSDNSGVIVIDNLVVSVVIDNFGVNQQSQRRGAQRDGYGTTEESGRAERQQQGRGDSGPDARSGAVLFWLRAVGQRTGLITNWGAGTFGFMRSVALMGPLTVPQIAQMRPTSRQRMQRLADELATDGLVEFIGNPRHRRSKLVRLTSKGEARYRELNARFLAIASTMGADLSEADIRKTTEIVRRLSDETKGRSEQSPRSIRLAASPKAVTTPGNAPSAPRRSPSTKP